jgi:hypothetical protein
MEKLSSFLGEGLEAQETMNTKKRRPRRKKKGILEIISLP